MNGNTAAGEGDRPRVVGPGSDRAGENDLNAFVSGVPSASLPDVPRLVPAPGGVDGSPGSKGGLAGRGPQLLVRLALGDFGFGLFGQV